jgi:hypothetical protein
MCASDLFDFKEIKKKKVMQFELKTEIILTTGIIKTVFIIHNYLYNFIRWKSPTVITITLYNLISIPSNPEFLN